MSKMLKKVISLFIMTCLISSSMGTFVFAENLGEKTIESEKICLEKDLDLETVVSLANELIPSKDISSEDVIVQESNDGNVRFIVPYNSIKQPIEELNISELMDNLKDDNNVSDINLQDNILTYTIFNNTDVEIIETVDGEITTLEITEGERTDILKFDSDSNEVFLNDEPIEYSIVQTYVFEENASSKAAGEWIYYGTSYPNLRGEESIRNLSVSVLASLMLKAFGWVGDLIGIASNIISTLKAYDSYTEVLYCEREIYRPRTGYYALKYYDDVYADEDYTELIESRTWIQYE